MNSPFASARSFGLLLGLITLAVYCFAAMHADFFILDDRIEIVSRPTLNQSLAEANSWRELLVGSGAGPTGRPIAVASFGVNVVVAGGEAIATQFKLLNVVLHGVAGLLVYLWCNVLFPDRKSFAAAAAMIWLLMPLQVSTVLYPVQRMAQLSAIFTLLGLWLFSLWRARWSKEGGSPAELLSAMLWLCLITFAAVMSKENGMLLPWLIVLVEWVFFRGEWRGQHSVLLERLSSAALFLPIVLAPSAVFLLTDWMSAYELRDFTLAERLLTQTRALLHYVAWAMFPQPSQLGLFHDDIAISKSLFAPWTTLASLIAWGMLLVAALRCRERLPWLSFGILFFLIAHSMESTFLPLEMFFEHRNYLPSVGLAIVVAGAIGLLVSSSRLKETYLYAAYTAPVFLILLLRLIEWSDAEQLYAAEISRHKDSLRGGYLYAMQLSQKNDRAESLTDEMQETRVLLARNRLVQLKERHERSLLPCAGLYSIDTQWFPDNPEQGGWLSCIRERLPPVSTSDINALSFAVERAIRAEANLAELRALLDELERVSGDALRWDLARWRLDKSLGQLSAADAVIAEIDSRYPDSIAAQFLLFDNANASAEKSELLDRIQVIYALDTKRSVLSQLLRRL
jgi:hypothetical protein